MKKTPNPHEIVLAKLFFWRFLFWVMVPPLAAVVVMLSAYVEDQQTRTRSSMTVELPR